jgi:hypothetical protein
VAKGGLLDAARDVNQASGVRVAAMTGVIRHIRGKLPNNSTGPTSGAILSILREKQPIGDMSADGFAWLRRQATDAAGLMGDAGPGNAIAIELAAVAGDQQAPLSLRTAAAKAIGGIDLRDAGGLDGAKLTAILGDLAVDALEAEHDGEFPNPRVAYQRISSVNVALLGADGKSNLGGKLKVAEPQQQAINDLSGSIVTSMELFADNATEMLEIEEAMRNVSGAMEKHKLERLAPPEAAAAN